LRYLTMTKSSQKITCLRTRSEAGYKNKTVRLSLSIAARE
jgi:hypothetical protein